MPKIKKYTLDFESMESSTFGARIQTCFHWMQPPIVRYWNFGFQQTKIFKILNSLPQPLGLAFEQVLKALTAKAENSISTMQTLSASVGWSNFEKDSILSQQIDPLVRFESASIGLIKVDYDHITQSRTRVDLNAFFARLWCMSKEQLLLRFADDNVPLPYSELDWLRSLVFDLETHFHNDTIKYSRLIFGNGQAVRAVLVEITSRKTFNSVGQITQV